MAYFCSMWHQLESGFSSRIEHSRGWQDDATVAGWELSSGSWLGASALFQMGLSTWLVGLPYNMAAKVQEGKTVASGLFTAWAQRSQMALLHFLGRTVTDSAEVQGGEKIGSTL